MKLKLLVIFLFSCGAIASAQLELRPSVGLLWASYEDVADVDFSAKTGFSFGADLMIGSRFYFQPGLHYEGKNLAVDTDSEDFDLSINKFTIPVLFGFKFFKPETDRVFNIRLFTGPSASFVLNVDDGDSQLGIDGDDFTDANFDWNAGVGVDFLIFYLNAGYRFGMNDVYDEFDIGSLTFSSGSQNLWYTNVGLRIRF